MPTRTRRDEYRKIAEDFLKRAKSAPTEEERADFLDMARAIERAAARVEFDGQKQIPDRRVD